MPNLSLRISAPLFLFLLLLSRFGAAVETTAVCAINSIAATPMGTLSPGDRLICTNKPTSGDTDRFSVKQVNTCTSQTPLIQIIVLGTGQSLPTEAQLQVTFTGRIANASALAGGTTTAVNICAGDTVQYAAVSDTVPPLLISLIRTTVDLVGGSAVVVGSAGSVEPDATVSVKNTSTNAMISAIARSDGSFEASLVTHEGDGLSIVVTDRHLNTSTVPDSLGNPIPAAVTVTAVADPATMGPYSTGWVVLDEPNGVSGITDPAWFQSPVDNPNPTLAWAKIMYPSTAPGFNAPLNSAGPYPVVLFLHGRHLNCDLDGGFSSDLNYLCDSDPGSCLRARCAYDYQRIPSHEGYDYIMEKLASQGILTISVSAHELQLYNEQWNFEARGRLVLRFLDKLRDWNDNGTDPFGGRFAGKLDLSRVGLSGHSRGGEGVVAAQYLNKSWPIPHSIKAVNAIAPTDDNLMGGKYDITDAAYFLLIGSYDGDVWGRLGFRVYDRAYPDPAGAVGVQPRYPKMVAYAHKANHNHFNTIWTDERDNEYWTMRPNPWAGAMDDSSVYPLKLSAMDQRHIAASSIVAFFRWQLQGKEPYREFLTGWLRLSTLPQNLFWTHQDTTRTAVDNFEQQPANLYSNTFGGSQEYAGFYSYTERQLAGIDPGINGETISIINHPATAGLILVWYDIPQASIVSYIPYGHRDASAYRYLSLRAGKRLCIQDCTIPDTGPINLFVNIEDGAGNRGSMDLSTDRYGIIPVPEIDGIFSHSQIYGIRIPLEHFTMNDSRVDLKDIVKITIRTDRGAYMGVDDIEFGN